ncbi:MAG: hypothetical protein NT123_17290 [Proteobacteria bacterium]|nr:hypothetical protein [Pseudomonadota bacterium]
MILRFAPAILLMTILAMPAAAAEEKSVREFSLPNMGRLELSMPSPWTDRMRQPPQGALPVITLSPAVGNGFQIVVLPSWADHPGAVLPGKEEMRRIVGRAADEATAHSIEKVLSPKEIAGASASGYYFSATDKAPKAGEFKYMAQGMLRVGDLALKFMALANDGAETALAETIEMLKTAKHVAHAPDAPGIGTEKPGRAANYRIEPGLGSSQKIGCIPLSEARNTYTPPDLYRGVSECLAKENYEFAARLFVLAGTYSAFDAERITNKEAGQSKSVMITNTLLQEPPEKQSRLNELMIRLMKTPELHATLCGEVQRIGMPGYFPGYMVLYGVKEASGNPFDGALVKDFDAPKSWAQLQSTYLSCPAGAK